MGADYYGLLKCELQREHGEGFIPLVKAQVSLRAIESMRAQYEAEADRPLEEAKIQFIGLNRQPRSGSVRELQEMARRLPAEGIPACAQCPLSGGRPVGCYRYVTYPIDEATEAWLFEYTCAVVREAPDAYVVAEDAQGRRHTAAGMLYDFVIRGIDREAVAGWDVHRGEEGRLAEGSTPLHDELRGLPITSSEVLAAAFHPIDGDLALQLYAAYWRDFLRWLEERDVDGRGTRVDELRGVADLLAGAMAAMREGPVMVHVDG